MVIIVVGVGVDWCWCWFWLLYSCFCSSTQSSGRKPPIFSSFVITFSRNPEPPKALLLRFWIGHWCSSFSQSGHARSQKGQLTSNGVQMAVKCGTMPTGLPPQALPACFTQTRKLSGNRFRDLRAPTKKQRSVEEETGIKCTARERLKIAITFREKSIQYCLVRKCSFNSETNSKCKHGWFQATTQKESIYQAIDFFVGWSGKSFYMVAIRDWVMARLMGHDNMSLKSRYAAAVTLHNRRYDTRHGYHDSHRIRSGGAG